MLTRCKNRREAYECNNVINNNNKHTFNKCMFIIIINYIITLISLSSMHIREL